MDTDLMVYISVKMTCDRLTEDQLVALHRAITDERFDPRLRMGYEHIEHLFAEANGTKMHDMTRRAFERVVINRLEAK